VPCARQLTPEEIESGYEKNTGAVIIEMFKRLSIDPAHVPAVICHNHGPFTWGKDAEQAVYHAVVLEEVCKIALFTLQINNSAPPAPQHLQDKHFMRKHGPGAYYGQKKG
jgi:L-ribulose-5-phosphate 4-epimerase